MKKIIIASSLVFLWAACQPNNNNNNSPTTAAPAAKLRETPATPNTSTTATAAPSSYQQMGNVYKHLSGTIGGKQVQIDLMITTKGIMGSYYDTDKNYYHLEGDTLQWIAAATSAAGLNTVKAQIQNARFSDPQTLTGNFVPINKGVKAAPLAFSLTETYNKSVPIELLQTQQKIGNCANNSDKSCCLIDLICPHIANNKPNILAANQQIEQHIADFANTGSTTIAQAAQSIETKYKATKNKGRWEVSVSPSVLYNYNGLLSLKLTQIRITPNDARPALPLKYLNFDTETGKALLLSDLFKPGYEAALRKLIQQKILANAGEEMKSALGSNMRLPKNFYLTPQGLTILYNPGEILPPQAGDFSATMSFVELKTILKNANLGNTL